MLVHITSGPAINLLTKIGPARRAHAIVQRNLTGVRYRDPAMLPAARQLTVAAELFGNIHVMGDADEFYFTKSGAKVSYWLWTKCDEQ